MLELLQYSFMQKALLAGSVISITCALLGVFLILRRMALIGDGFSHIAFGGVAFGLFASKIFDFIEEKYAFFIALIFSVISALGIVKLREYAKVYGDVSIGIVFSFALALGVILISLAHGFSVDLHSFLFGNIISITDEDVYLAMALGGIVFVLLALYQKELMYLSFDEVSAKVAGIPVSKLNTLLIVLTAIMVVISIRIVGILLISSFLIIPPAAALIVSRSFKQTLLISALFAFISLIVGLFGSYYLDLASGGAIVMCSILIFCICTIYRKIRS
jgi:zinc transport system permease protein